MSYVHHIEHVLKWYSVYIYYSDIISYGKIFDSKIVWQKDAFEALRKRIKYLTNNYRLLCNNESLAKL